MIAKLIASAPDRAGAIARLAQALEETAVAGPKTNASFLHALTVHPAFAAGRMDTGLIARELETLGPQGNRCQGDRLRRHASRVARA